MHLTVSEWIEKFKLNEIAVREKHALPVFSCCYSSSYAMSPSGLIKSAQHSKTASFRLLLWPPGSQIVGARSMITNDSIIPESKFSRFYLTALCRKI